jgi:PAS domain S-box-containing protein
MEFTEEKWRLALEATGDGTWELDGETSRLRFSPRWLEYFGPHLETIPENMAEWERLIHPEDYQFANGELAAHLRGEQDFYRSEFRVKCRDGSYKWILSKGIVFARDEEGGALKMIGVHVGIHNRKAAEEELRTSIDTFANAFKYSGIGMALLSPRGRWLDVNDALCNMLGYTKDELLELTFQDITYPDDLESDMGFVRRILKREIDSYELEKRYISKENKIVSVRLTVSTVWNNDGTLRFFISQIVDHTDKKAMIEELGRKNSELEATRLSLVNKLNQLEELNYIIAHNLRGPANNIQGLTVLLQNDPGDAERLSGMIQEAGQSLTNSLNTLMEVAQLSLNRSIPFDECDVEEMICRILSQLHNIIFEKHAQVTRFLLIPMIRYPKIYLESILYNLINNALKYSRADVAPRVAISTFEEEGRIRLSVRDNGLGIDLNRYADRIFKLHQVFHQGFDSKGLGLFMTKSQVESLGGAIEVRSSVHEGSEFLVTL